MSVFYCQVIGEDRLSYADAGFVRLCARFSGKSARLGLGNILAARLLWALSAAMAGSVAFGCGSPAANLEISVPSSAIVGLPFTVTVTAMVDGRRDTIFNSPIHFTSSDSAAILPADYAFTATDAGSHTFTNGVTMMTAGSQSIKVTDVIASSITATVNFTVTAATTDRHFNVRAPSTLTAGSAFSTTLSAEDANGYVVTGYTRTVHFTQEGSKRREYRGRKILSVPREYGGAQAGRNAARAPRPAVVRYRRCGVRETKAVVGCARVLCSAF